MKFILKLIIPFVFIVLAFMCVKILISKKQPSLSRVPDVVAPQVDIIAVDQKDHQPPILSYGTVQSYFETTLTPQVSGQITEVAEGFRVGNMVKKGALLARIDDTDYTAVLAQESANLTTAKRTLLEEEIKAKQAEQDWRASGRNINSASDFVLRKPQLEAARANIQSAMATEAKAKADIERTMIRAPYDAVVLERMASLGNYANQQQPLGKLVATERVEVRLPLTADQAALIDLPGLHQENAARLTVTLTSATKAGAEWQGWLMRTEPSVDPQNQVTYVIAEVEGPYQAKPEPLVVGTFVNARIPGRVIAGSYKIPEAALVNDAYVWVVSNEDKLCRITAKRVYGHEAHVYLRLSDKELQAAAIKPPLHIVTRPLATFKHGKDVKPAFVSEKR